MRQPEEVLHSLHPFMQKIRDSAMVFLENGTNVNFADPEGNTALYYAIKRKYKN